MSDAIRKALRDAPRPVADGLGFDQIAYMDWYFKTRLAALRADRAALSAPEQDVVAEIVAWLEAKPRGYIDGWTWRDIARSIASRFGGGNDGWCFDMEKAPRDGTEILLGDSKDPRRIFHVHWSSDSDSGEYAWRVVRVWGSLILDCDCWCRLPTPRGDVS